MIRIPILRLRLWTLTLLSGIVAASLGAEIIISPYFGSNGVLQREKPVPIWGQAPAGEVVTVEFSGQSQTATADSHGRWMVTLEPMPVDTEGKPLTIRGSQSETQIELNNIVVGDVWFCSGQSNMAWSVQASDDFEAELAAADYPLIRYFRVEDKSAAEPQDSIARFVWRITTPGTNFAGANPTDTRVHSAVAYYFARDVFNETGIPIGLITAARGGTPIESWMSVESMQSTPWWNDIEDFWHARLERYPRDVERFQQQLAEWEKAAAEAEASGTEPPRKPRTPEVIPGGRFMPGGLYNGMVHPFFPMAIRGILWYQGESNAGRHEAYADLFPTMIRDWRNSFDQGDLPFYFVQLANFIVNRDRTGQSWAFLREAQMEALALPNTGVAIAVDVGDPHNVHPGNKQAVGNRLARLALTHLEGRDMPWSGPVVESIEFSPTSATVTFSDADGLTLEGEAANAFMLAASDQVFHPANARISGNSVILSAPEVGNPVAIRYNWDNNPQSHLYNSAGLPASPFRSDDWPAD